MSQQISIFLLNKLVASAYNAKIIKQSMVKQAITFMSMMTLIYCFKQIYYWKLSYQLEISSNLQLLFYVFK